MSAEHVKYFKFANTITAEVFALLIGECAGIKNEALDYARTVWDEAYDPERDDAGHDFPYEFSGWLANGLEKYLKYDARGANFGSKDLFGSLIRAGFHSINFDEVAEAILKHEDEWDGCQEEMARREAHHAERLEDAEARRQEGEGAEYDADQFEEDEQRLEDMAVEELRIMQRRGL